jgi:membrane fusion protein (multidrug efflux system)
MRPAAITIPQRAVLEGPGTKIVLTVNAQGLVEPRPIQVGDWVGQDWIITSGLKAGDQVIVDGMVKAAPGKPVKIAQPAPVGTPPAAAPAEAPKPAAEGGKPAPAGKPEAASAS